MKAVKVKIYGQVQGVFFRTSTQKEALDLNLTGWVRNAADGSVEILAQGEEQALQKFIDWCHKGSTLAKVEKIEITPLEEISQQMKEFEIK